MTTQEIRDLKIGLQEAAALVFTRIVQAKHDLGLLRLVRIYGWLMFELSIVETKSVWAPEALNYEWVLKRNEGGAL